MKNNRLKMKFEMILCLCLLVLCVGLNYGQIPNEPQTLLPDQTIEREMTGAETHRYKVSLKADEFFQVHVEQKGLDVVLKLLDNKGNILTTMDTPTGKEGVETLSFVIEKFGSFFLEVSGFDSKAEKGTYIIKREDSRPVTISDKKRIEAESIFMQRMNWRNKNSLGELEKFLPKLNTSLQIWRELSDKYMTELVLQEISSIKKSYAGGLFYTGLDYEKGNTKEGLIKAIEFYQKAKVIYAEIGNFEDEAKCLVYVADNYYLLDQNQKALDYYLQSLHSLKRENPKGLTYWELYTRAKSRTSILYSVLGEEQKALENYLDWLDFIESAKKAKYYYPHTIDDDKVSILSSIGVIYFDLGDKLKALEYFNQAVKGDYYYYGGGDKRKFAPIYENMGFLYKDLGEIIKANEYFKKALDAYNTSKKYYEQRITSIKQTEYADTTSL